MLLVVFVMCARTKESLTIDLGKCKDMTAKSLWDQYDFRSRIQNKNGNWRCPKGWEDTGCTWDINGQGKSKEFDKKQCRRKKTNVRQGLLGNKLQVEAAILERGGQLDPGSGGTSRKDIEKDLIARGGQYAALVGTTNSQDTPEEAATRQELISQLELLRKRITEKGGQAPTRLLESGGWGDMPIKGLKKQLRILSKLAARAERRSLSAPTEASADDSAARQVIVRSIDNVRQQILDRGETPRVAAANDYGVDRSSAPLSELQKRLNKLKKQLRKLKGGGGGGPEPAAADGQDGASV
jgi:ribosomal 50S subunit-associated protein YjgA (DUF615 family)